MREKKKSIRIGLYDFSVPYVDTEKYSPKYFNLTYVPDVLTAGKNVFKLAANPTYLSTNSRILFEVLDSNMQPVYSEVLDYTDSDGSKIIVVYVDEMTAQGTAIVTLAGTAARSPSGKRLSSVDLNLKHSFKIPISPTQRNSSEILFLTEPTIDIQEKVVSYLDVRRPLGAMSSSITFYNGSYRYGGVSGQQPVLTINSNMLQKSYDGAVVTFTSEQNLSPQTGSQYGGIDTTTVGFTSSIKKVLNDTTALLSEPYVIDYRDGIHTHTYKSFDSSQVTITYNETGSYESTQNEYSYALVKISGLDPSTGDVSRARVYVKSNGAPVSDYRQVYDSTIQANNLFVDTGSNELLRNIGDIRDSSYATSYYEVLSVGGAPSASISYDRSVLLNSVKAAYASPLSANQYYAIATKTTYPLSFNEHALYTLSFDAVGKYTQYKSSSLAMDIYMSGSAFDATKSTESALGKLIGTITSDGRFTRIDSGSIDFSADKSGNGVLQFVERGGDWYLSNINVASARHTGFTPDTFWMVIQIPSVHINDRIDFRFEFSNYKSDESSLVMEVRNKFFRGGNVYISGENNILSGSLFVASESGSGVQISGTSGSYVRSVGYDGFVSASNASGQPGFVMWSGSILPTSGDSYGGVGLELFGSTSSYFRFRTDPSILEIVASSFFIGATGSQFVSASGGRLVISSSNFYLDEFGNLTIGSGATILGSLSANSIATPASGPPFKSQITSDGYAKFTSASIGGFDIDDITISSTNDQLILSSSGEITASNVLFGNKATSNYLQYLNGTLTVQGDITVNQIFTPALIGGSPSTTMNASASITSGGYARFVSASIGGFDVTTTTISSTNSLLSLYSNGEISASRVHVTGGDLAGFRITSGYISSSNNKVLIDSNLEKISIGTPSVDANQVTLTSAGFLVSGSGEMNLSKDASNYIRLIGSTFDVRSTNAIFSGSTVQILTPNFYFGSPTSYISGSNGNIDVSFATASLSGSQIRIQTKDFFFGVPTSFISGSNGSIVISGSNVSISTPTFFLGDSNQYISGSNGNISVSFQSASLSGSQIRINSPDFYLGTPTAFVSGSGGNLVLSGSSVSISTPSFLFGDGNTMISGSNGGILVSGSGVSVLTPTFYLGNASTFVSGANGRIVVSGSNLVLQTKDYLFGSDTSFISGSPSGILISGSQVDIRTSKFYFGDSSTFISGANGNIAISGSNVDIQTNKFMFGNSSAMISGSVSGILISGSSVDVRTTRFFFGSVGSQYISGSDGNLEISSSRFRLSPQGEMTASAGEIGGLKLDSGSLYSANGRLHISSSGEITASVIRATGSFTGSFVGDGSGLTGIIATLPSGVISSSAQVSASISGSRIVSSSTQIASYGFLLASGSVIWNDVEAKPSNLVSSSTQISAFGFLTSTGSVRWNDVESKPSGIVSSSTQTISNLNGTNLISSSAQLSASLSGSGIFSGSFSGLVSSSTQTLTHLNGTNIISSSAQLSASLSGSNIVSGTYVDVYNSLRQIDHTTSGNATGFTVNTTEPTYTSYLDAMAVSVQGDSGVFVGLRSYILNSTGDPGGNSTGSVFVQVRSLLGSGSYSSSYSSSIFRILSNEGMGGGIYVPFATQTTTPTVYNVRLLIAKTAVFTPGDTLRIQEAWAYIGSRVPMLNLSSSLSTTASKS